MSHKKSLFICMPDLPFPARKNGISIRYFPIIEHAAKHFDIHLLVISSFDIGDEDIIEARKYCRKVSAYKRKPKKIYASHKVMARVKSLFPKTIPFNQLHFDEAEIAEFIQAETASNYYDIALSVLITYQHLINRFVKATRYTIDLIDSPYSTSLRLTGNSLLKKYDAYLVKCWERRTIKQADYACYISPLDRKLGAGANINSEKIGIIPNGLFLQDHSDERVNYNGRTIAYLGHMGYPPNLKAALRLHKIFDRVKHQLDDVKLVIIGRDPTPEIQALANEHNVVVTGTVDNIWHYINGVDIFVFPMEIGSGQQNKLLEAMQAGIPVVSTSLGNSGIGAIDQEHILIADTDEDISNAILRLFAHTDLQKRIGENGKTFVQHHYAWPKILELIDNTLLNDM